MAEFNDFLAQLTALDPIWPSVPTYLVTLDVEPYRVEGLDPTLLSYNGSRDLQTPIQSIKRVIETCTTTVSDTGNQQRSGLQKAAVFLMRSCAQILHFVHVGSSDAASISGIQTDAGAAEQAYTAAGDVLWASWASFIRSMGHVMCEDVVDPSRRGKILGEVIGNNRGLSEVAGNVCLRLALRLRRREDHIQAAGDFERVSRLLLYGMGLCEATSKRVVLAQMCATYGRVMVEVNLSADASNYFERAYDYAIFGYDTRTPRDTFKPVVDEILKNLTATGDEKALEDFYNKLETTWPLRFRDGDANATLRHWINQNATWIEKVNLRRLIRENNFAKAQQHLAEIFARELPEDNFQKKMELFRRTNLGMNYGQVEFARETIEQLDQEPYNIFSTVMQWDRYPHDTWVAFGTCVERTAFQNSVRFLRRLENFPTYLSLSPDPRDHKDLQDYKKLVHVARVYIFQDKWAESLGLLKCSCSLITQQRQRIANQEIRDSQLDNSDAEKAFDWIVWVCLHFHSVGNIPTPKALYEDAKYNSWAEEALRYAEMGKARRIGDTLRKNIHNDVHTPPAQSSQPPLDENILDDLAAWLDPDTLVIHLTLIHEGLGLICLDTHGIHFAQWFPGMPSFGTWDAQRLTSVIFNVVDHPNNRRGLDDRPRARTRFQDAIAELSCALIAPVEETLNTRRPRRLCFVPAGHLMRVPFAALELDGEPIVERFSIYQVPSLAILRELSLAAGTGPRTLANVSVVARSSHTEEADILDTAMECVDVASQFGTAAHLRSATDLDDGTFLDLYRTGDVVHVGTHGHMDYRHPLRSHLDLHHRFSVSHLLHADSRATLVFLSACLSGLGVSTLMDDLTGFQAAVLESGASAFAGSLWNAHTLASLFFVHFFYARLLESSNQSLADVFAAGQRDLRRLDRRGAERLVEAFRTQEVHGVPDDLLRDSREFLSNYDPSVDHFGSAFFWAPYILVGCSPVVQGGGGGGAAES